MKSGVAKDPALKEALLFAAWGGVAYFLLYLVLPKWFLIIGIPVFMLFRPYLGLIEEIPFLDLFLSLFGILITGAILGLMLWLICRLGITLYERRRQPTLRL